jgi:hypothetical protein
MPWKLSLSTAAACSSLALLPFLMLPFLLCCPCPCCQRFSLTNQIKMQCCCRRADHAGSTNVPHSAGCSCHIPRGDHTDLICMSCTLNNSTCSYGLTARLRHAAPHVAAPTCATSTVSTLLRHRGWQPGLAPVLGSTLPSSGQCTICCCKALPH